MTVKNVLSFRLIYCIKTKVWFRQFDSWRIQGSREGKVRTWKITKLNNKCIIDYGGHQAMFWNTITKFCACWTWNNPTRENILFRTFFSVLVGANWQQKPHICVKWHSTSILIMHTAAVSSTVHFSTLFATLKHSWHHIRWFHWFLSTYAVLLTPFRRDTDTVCCLLRLWMFQEHDHVTGSVWFEVWIAVINKLLVSAWSRYHTYHYSQIQHRRRWVMCSALINVCGLLEYWCFGPAFIKLPLDLISSWIYWRARVEILQTIQVFIPHILLIDFILLWYKVVLRQISLYLVDLLGLLEAN